MSTDFGGDFAFKNAYSYAHRHHWSPYSHLGYRRRG